MQLFPQGCDGGVVGAARRGGGTGVPGHLPERVRPEGGAADRPSGRFRVRDGERVRFEDLGFGGLEYEAGRDFGDFVVWRGDGFPSYQLACVADDAAMGITEVVRGADLLMSTARQLLLYRALGWDAPRFLHCPLVTDADGVRLAKRHASLSLRRLREEGKDPADLRRAWAAPGERSA